MPTIRLHDTRTRAKVAFVPADATNVRMYVCGPTVYDRAHLGNARSVVVFDALFRLLRHVFGADRVTYARNVTDVDDKINARAAETGRPIREVTDETLRWFHEDMDALGALRPTHEPRATEWIAEMVAMIEELVARGHAYEARGHVLFRVRSFPEYGALSGRSLDDMIAGARVEVAPFKKDPLDFVLWKPSSGDEPGWDSPWGRGRPGWHIECSAMARALLGENFDIHGGGLDLQFPHHENEIAQSRCAHPDEGFARLWVHNEMLQVEGRKMSKSLGNFFTVRDLLDRGVAGEAIRLVLLGTHHGKPMDWTDGKRAEAEATLRRWRDLAGDAAPAPEPARAVVDALADDLNTPGAIAALHDLHARAKDDPALVPSFKASAWLLGLLADAPAADAADAAADPEVAFAVGELLALRAEARRARDFDTADRIRRALRAAGIRLMDTKDGAAWSLEKDELDPAPFVAAVRAAQARGDAAGLAEARAAAAAAGVGLGDGAVEGPEPAWRARPSRLHVLSTLHTARDVLGGVA